MTSLQKLYFSVTSKQVEEVINAWNNKHDAWRKGWTEEQVESEYLLEMLSSRLSVFQDDVDLIINIYTDTEIIYQRRTRYEVCRIQITRRTN